MCQPLKRCAVEPEAFDSLSGAVCIGVAVDSVPGGVELVVEWAGISGEHHHAAQPLEECRQLLVLVVVQFVPVDLPVALWRTFVLRVEWT